MNLARRLPLLLLALLLAIPALAVPGDLTVTGVISAVDGNKVSLNGGIVVLDVTTAQIIARGNGAATGVAALIVGAPVVAVVTAKGSDGSLVASTVLVGSADAIELRGTLDAVDATAGTLTLHGLTIATSPRTAFTGETSRGPVRSLADLMAGDAVTVEAVRSAGGLLARHVHANGSGTPGGQPVIFVGKVDAISAASWTISGRSVLVTSTTQITGSPAVGDLVKVKANADAAGVLTALTIEKLATLPDPPLVPIHGVLEVKSAASWTVSGTVVKIDSSTVIRNDPKVGDRVMGMARRASDGSLTAALLIGMPPGPGGPPSLP